jgi:hypothetical protein
VIQYTWEDIVQSHEKVFGHSRFLATNLHFEIHKKIFFSKTPYTSVFKTLHSQSIVLGDQENKIKNSSRSSVTKKKIQYFVG